MSEHEKGYTPRLAPIRVQAAGTGDVESLSSVLCGAAQEHSVLTHSLLAFVASEGGYVSASLRRRSDLYTLNGYGPYARHFVGRLAKIAPEGNREISTCLPWASWQNPMGHTLLHRKRRWCRLCLLTDKAQGRRPYQRLYWCLGPSTICVHHRKPLADVCPKCNAPQPHMPRLPFLDACDRCGHDLVDGTDEDDYPGPDGIWDSEAVHQLITATHADGAKSLEGSDVVRLVNDLIRALADGSARRLARLTGIEWASVRDWSSGATRPSFAQFLRFCRAVSCPPSALATGFPLFVDPALIVKRDLPRLREVVPRDEDDHAKLLGQVDDFVRGEMPRAPSLKAVARAVGRTESVLMHRYPERCAEIVEAAARERERIAAKAVQDRKGRAKAAVEECLAAGVYPSDRHLRATGQLNSTALQRPETRSYLRTIREALREGVEDPTGV